MVIRTNTTGGVFVLDKIKICTKCREELPATIDYFPKRKDSKDGFYNLCKKCKYERHKKYKKDNKEQFIEYNKKHLKKYRENNKELLSIIGKDYYRKNAEKIKQRTRSYHYKNKNKVREYRKLKAEHIRAVRKLYRENNYLKLKEMGKNWRLKNKDAIKLYKQSNSENDRIHVEKRRSLKKKLPSQYTISEWDKCKNDFGNKCSYCGKEVKLTQDHFIPLSKDGEYTKNNIVPACGSCNPSKGNRDFFDWYPKQKFYSEQRENKILSYLNYNKLTKNQQLAFTI
jgi:5-methylcytosine-specific restriction endonuclease McrA